MKIRIGDVHKRVNSTKQEVEKFIEVEAVLKDKCSIINPVLQLKNISEGANIYTYNYAYIPTFDRHYFISNISWNMGVWELECSCDVLASWKDTILSHTKYVLRSTSQFDTTIIDTFYPAKQSFTFSVNESDVAELQTSVDDGCYIIGTVSSTNNALGSTAYYVCSKAQASAFFEYMLNGVPDWTGISDFSGDVAKAFIDPFQYVVSCKWFPLSKEVLSDPLYSVLDTIKFGFWDSGVQAHALLGAQFSIVKSFKFPVETTRTYLYYPPYSDYWMYMGVFGVVPVQRSNFQTSIKIVLKIDLVDGTGTLKMRNDSATVTQLSQNMSADISINSIQMRVPTKLGEVLNAAVTSLISSASSIVSGGSVGDAVQANFTKAQSSGTSQGIVALTDSKKWALIGKHYKAVDEDLNENGRPLCKNWHLGSLTGFCIVDDGNIEGNMTLQEQQQIKAFLEGGFFIE